MTLTSLALAPAPASIPPPPPLPLPPPPPPPLSAHSRPPPTVAHEICPPPTVAHEIHPPPTVAHEIHPPPTVAYEIINYIKLKVPELKAKCREFGLLVGGTKKVLIARLQEFQDPHQASSLSALSTEQALLSMSSTERDLNPPHPYWNTHVRETVFAQRDHQHLNHFYLS
ncbi:hypothetical protein BC936DRAFT_136941 [Jimgerdemannia flammicorona]|uniref:SAP domain-containing protein n=1 Tax=Jimgerdemannia flammicorona TaxID=994334 RepID=A0A433CYF1_9FUNG|nr:hypothetical protein BC936DRAFT_136941 [Jimgerdemannia flammicorona]